MRPSPNRIDVYLEIGKKRTFTGAMDWPGWSRSGRDEASALDSLLHYGPCYARVVASARLGFRAPVDLSQFFVTERLAGNATTDFGAPRIAPSSDGKPLEAAEIVRAQAILGACWRAFDADARAAEGSELRKGPRGGGRELAGIIEHVLEADAAYMSRLGRRFKRGEAGDAADDLRRIREAILDALRQTQSAEMPARGPRGGARWTPRYFVRRACWHVIDHAWEIEDRIT
jgi:hypothetical protein